jgi:7-carboxy-7-deazaguanine synthase
MLQPELPALAQDLLDRGYEVAVETHGQLPLDGLPDKIVRIADVKTPESGEAATDLSWLARLGPADEVKFVVSSEADFRWALQVIRGHGLEDRVVVLVGPVLGRVAPRDLAGWILESGLRGRLNLQLHKVIWGAEARGV